MANNTATTNTTVTVSDKKKFFEKAMEESIHPSPKPGNSLSLMYAISILKLFSIGLVCYMLKPSVAKSQFSLSFYSNCLWTYIAYNKYVLVRFCWRVGEGEGEGLWEIHDKKQIDLFTSY